MPAFTFWDFFLPLLSRNSSSVPIPAAPNAATDARGASPQVSPITALQVARKLPFFPNLRSEKCNSEAPELWLHKSGVYSARQDRSWGRASRMPSRTFCAHPALLTCAHPAPPVPIALLTCAHSASPMRIALLPFPSRSFRSYPSPLTCAHPAPPCPSRSSPARRGPAGWAPPPGMLRGGAQGAWPGQAQGSARPRRLYAEARAAPERGEGCRGAGGSAARPSWERGALTLSTVCAQFAEQRCSDAATTSSPSLHPGTTRTRRSPLPPELHLLGHPDRVTQEGSQESDFLLVIRGGFAVNINVHTMGLRGASIWMEGVFLHRGIWVLPNMCALPVKCSIHCLWERKGKLHQKWEVIRAGSAAEGPWAKWPPRLRRTEQWWTSLNSSLKEEHGGQMYWALH